MLVDKTVLIFLLSLFQESVFWRWKAEIFDWNSDNKENHVNKRHAYKRSPVPWKVYRFSMELVGIFVGWNLIIFFVDKFIYLERYHANIGSLWNLLLVLVLGLVGISGRIPVIIETVQDWFKKS